MGAVALALAAASASITPAVAEGLGILHRDRSFPVLGAFDHPACLRYWTAQGGDSETPTRIRFSGRELQVDAGAGGWAGASYRAGEQDWSAFGRLHFVVDSPAGPLALTLMATDADARRAYLPINVPAGRSENKVPLPILAAAAADGPLDLRRVRRLAFFTGENQPARTYRLGSVQLAK